MAGPFELALREFAQKAGDKADLAVRKVALDMLTRVVHRSPVDTGRFRGNWQVSVGAPPTGTLTTTDKSGPETIQRGLSALPVKAAGQVIFVANNLPYAWKLETGYSKQAPLGMVALTVMEFRQIVDGAANYARGMDSISVLGTP